MTASVVSTVFYKIKKTFRESFLAKAITLTIFVGLFATLGIYFIEQPYQVAIGNTFGLTEALWWTIATITTIGYGDVVPITMAGKFFGMVIAIYGAGVWTMLVVYIVTWILNRGKISRDAKVIVEIDATKSMIGKKFKDLYYSLKEEENLILIGVKREDKKYFNPEFEFVIEKDDFLIVARERILSDKITIYDL
ncbi:MAG: hypothetical protein EAX96_13105 [Candidatus Lokiarchaeota archaeon]|nr:hypothetical protein [Candidatus Lokiarchaeota archaeon]